MVNRDIDRIDQIEDKPLVMRKTGTFAVRVFPLDVFNISNVWNYVSCQCVSCLRVVTIISSVLLKIFCWQRYCSFK